MGLLAEEPNSQWQKHRKPLFPGKESGRIKLYRKESGMNDQTIGERPHILVIDDDPLFRTRIQKIAQERDLPITVCSSLKEVNAMSCSRLFDIAIVDYYLDDFRDTLRGTEVAEVLGSVPVILTSHSDHCLENNTPFPEAVRQFVHKKAGINHILDKAIDTLELQQR